MSNKKPKDELVKIFWVSLGIIFSGAVFVLIFIFILSRDLPSLEQLENYDPDLVTRIYSADGVVLSELFVQKRVFVELNNIPKHMQDAVIASEDRRFYDHWGLSLRSVARAIGINILSLSYRQGFSTLTQQLARNLYKTIGFEDSILRKIKEVIGLSKKNKTNVENNKGMFIKIKSFLLVNLSIKNPDPNKVMTDNIE